MYECKCNVVISRLTEIEKHLNTVLELKCATSFWGKQKFLFSPVGSGEPAPRPLGDLTTLTRASRMVHTSCTLLFSLPPKHSIFPPQAGWSRLNLLESRQCYTPQSRTRPGDPIVPAREDTSTTTY